MVKKRAGARKVDRPYVKQPTIELPPIEHAVDEGMLIARSALTMEVKNHIIVSTLRDQQAFDAEQTAAFVTGELEQMAREQTGYATRMDRSALDALGSRGEAIHQHDYHSPDYPALTRRGKVYRGLAEEMVRLSAEPDFVAEVVESAREQAWAELSTAIEARFEPLDLGPVDENYDRDRDERLASFLALDLAGLVPVSRFRRRK